jgi:hypothetical protein
MALPKTESRFDIETYLAWKEIQPECHEYFACEACSAATAE